MSARLRALIAARHEAARQRELDGVALLAHRTALGLTQVQLAEKLGLHPNHIACMERGERAVTARTFLHVRALRMAAAAAGLSEVAATLSTPPTSTPEDPAR